MRKVAITGGLASGKSSVLKLFEEKGAYTVSADQVVHQLLSPKTQIGKKIIDLLGEEIIVNGEFDREKIANKIFNDREALKKMESILHPATFEEIEKQLNQIKNQEKYTLFVAEIPLLYESENAHLFDVVIAVDSDPKIAKKRFGKNNKKDEFEKRMTHQLPVKEKCAKADYVIQNNGSYEELKPQVEVLYNKLTK